MTKIIKIITLSNRSETKTEVTRWNVKGEWTDKVWEELIAKLQKLFNVRHTQFFISWFDGEDYCTIRDVSDLEEAVECMESGEGESKICRIYASPEKTAHQTIFGVTPSVDPEEVKEFPPIENLDLDSEKTIEDEQPGSGSNWEVLNLEGDEVKAETAVEKDPLEQPEVQQEEKHREEEAVPVPVTAAAVPTPAVTIGAETGQSVEPAASAATASAIAATAPAAAAAAAPIPPCLSSMYGIPQYYMPPGIAPGMQPMYAPQWPVTQMTPMVYPGMELQSMQLPTQNAPSAPLLPQQQQPTPPAPAAAMTPEPKIPTPIVEPGVPEVEEQECQQPAISKSDVRKKDKSNKAHYMNMCMTTLRSMGYSQDEKVLKRVIRNKKGNLNEILDELNRAMGHL